MPGFVPKEARRILYEAGKGLRTLKVATNGLHPLCNIRQAIDIRWIWGDSEKRYEKLIHRFVTSTNLCEPIAS